MVNYMKLISFSDDFVRVDAFLKPTSLIYSRMNLFVRELVIEVAQIKTRAQSSRFYLQHNGKA